MTGITIQPLAMQLFGSILWILYRVLTLFINKKSRPIKECFSERQLIILLFGIYVAFTFSLTILPISITWVEDPYRPYITPFVNLIPFEYSHIINYYFFRNIFGNLVLLAPLGFFLPLLYRKFRNLKYCLAAAFVTSFTIEALQYLLTYLQLTRSGRATDITDLILNTLGGIIGYIIFRYLFEIQ